MRFYLDGDEIKANFIPTKAHEGYMGVCHGGVLTALLEEAMGWAPSWHNKWFTVAVEINIRFLKPVPIGKMVIATARATRTHGRLWEAEGEIVGQDGTIYVKGRGRYYPLKPEQVLTVLNYLSYDDDTIAREEFERGVRKALAQREK